MNCFELKNRENQYFINPKFPIDQTKELLDRVYAVSNQFRSHSFLLTSGTTSSSIQGLKWVALSQDAIVASAESVNRHLQSSPNDIWLHALPDFHVGGIGIRARSELSGARVVRLEVWNSEKYLELIETERATLSALVPTQVFDLVHQGKACPPSLRAVIVGGAALSESLYRRGVELGWPFLPSYGMTETSSQIATAPLPIHSDLKSSNPASKSPSKSMMQILSHASVVESEEGTLRIRSESLLTAYIEAGPCGPIVVDPKVDGWFYSQDHGNVQGQTLTISGRKGEFVKIGGESVEVGRLRNILDEIRCKNNLKSDVALVPIYDERLGNVIHLISDFQLSLTDRENLVQDFNKIVLGFERIRAAHSFQTIPRNALGKLMVSQCAEQIQSK